MLGHADIASTQIYTRVSLRKLEAVHAATHPVRRTSRAARAVTPRTARRIRASSELIERAGKALAEAAGADSRVILFGSYARGEQRRDSDLYFLVIEPEVEDRFGESVRLARLVGELGVPADVMIASEAEHADDLPNLSPWAG